MAEGFLEARLLARKFITLYSLCKELLSKQDHYDWGLRAIKSVLVVAGALKRGDPDRPEDQVYFYIILVFISINHNMAGIFPILKCILRILPQFHLSKHLLKTRR